MDADWTDEDVWRAANPSLGETASLAFYREQDQPLDRSGLVQKYLAVQLRFSFDVSKQDLGLAPAGFYQ